MRLLAGVRGASSRLPDLGRGLAPVVAVRHVQHRHGAEGVSYIVISVKNDGIGISAAEISALADPFTIAAGSADPSVRELGIGLSVSRRMVAAHGGAIYCKSDLGQGAQFSIWLPLNA